MSHVGTNWQQPRSGGPVHAALITIPGGFAGVAGGAFLGGSIAKMIRVHLQLFIGVLVQTLCVGLYGLLTPNNLVLGIVLQFFANLPFAWITLCCYIVAGLNVPQRDLGLALGLVELSGSWEDQLEPR